MAIGKSKKKYKKGAKKRIDPQTRKEWYELKAPTPFQTISFGKTCVTRSTGTKIASEQLKGRIITSSLADLKKSDQHWRKIKLMIEDVEGKNCITSFYGMGITKDKFCNLIRKRQTLVETFVNVKTLDGYFMRVFCAGFTKKQAGQTKKTAYAQQSKVKLIRKKMIDIIFKEAKESNLIKFVTTLTTDSLSPQIQKACKFIFPLENVYITKVKMLKKPKFDPTKLQEMYAEQKRDEPTADKQQEQDQWEEENQNLLKK